jgi:hypothetical protein
VCGTPSPVARVSLPGVTVLHEKKSLNALLRKHRWTVQRFLLNMLRFSGPIVRSCIINVWKQKVYLQSYRPVFSHALATAAVRLPKMAADVSLREFVGRAIENSGASIKLY